MVKFNFPTNEYVGESAILNSMKRVSTTYNNSPIFTESWLNSIPLKYKSPNPYHPMSYQTQILGRNKPKSIDSQIYERAAAALALASYLKPPSDLSELTSQL